MARPEPTPHVRHAAHVLRPAVAVNVPAPHAPHDRSLDAVATTVVCKPGAHGWRTAAQALPSSVLEYVEPATQAAQVRSAVAVPSVARPEPTPHVRHALHDAALPAALLNWPAGHASHVRSDDALGAVFS